MAHHTTKASLNNSGAPELEAIAWSGFSEWCRQWILLARREKYDPEQSGVHKLWISAGGSAGHSQAWGLDIEEGHQDDEGGCRWDVDIIKASQARYEAYQSDAERQTEQKAAKVQATRDKRRDDVLRALERYPGGAFKTTIRDASGMSSTTFTPILNDLIDSGMVIDTAEDGGKPWFKLSTNSVDGQTDNSTRTSAKSVPWFRNRIGSDFDRMGL